MRESAIIIYLEAYCTFSSYTGTFFFISPDNIQTILVGYEQLKLTASQLIIYKYK